MKNITTLKDLMTLHLLSLYDAEWRWFQSLKEIAQGVASNELRKIFEADAKKAKAHAHTLEDILEQMEKNKLPKKNAVAHDLIKEMHDLQKDLEDTEVLNAGLIVTQQCMNHYRIAKYGTVASYARLLQMEHIANTLHELMEEEKAADEELSLLAEERINLKAKTNLVI